MPRRAMIITSRFTYCDDRLPGPTPADYAAGGLAGLLDRITPAFGDQGCVLLDAGPVGQLGLPSEEAAEAARAAGWKASGKDGWWTFYGPGRPLLRVGLLPLVDRDETPVLAPTPGETVTALARWHELTGAAWFGGAGVAGLQIFKNVNPPGKGAPTLKPTRPGPMGTTVPAGPLVAEAVEMDYKPAQWRARRAGTEWAHGYDLNRAYVGTLSTIKVAPWTLKPGRRDWSPELAGWWKVDLAPWTIDHMPHPAGYDHTGKGSNTRWITGPTMELLHQLAEEGAYGGILKIHESWTGAGKEILKPFGATMSKAWKDNRAKYSDPYVFEALKLAGRASLGLFDTETNFVYRPDWWHAIIAGTRATMFRRAWRIGGGRDGAGPWPLWYDVDNVYYGSDVADPWVAAPAGLPLGPVGELVGDQLGKYKPKKSRQSRRKRGN